MTSSPAGQTSLARALAYARHGWPVFPCRPGRKEPDTVHGFKDASTDPGQITAWWTAEPARNVAIATGAPGPDVLDIDVRPDGSGYPALDRLKRAGLLEGPLAIVATPGGGLHAYYTGTAQASGRLTGYHLDFKASGGYVLAPPSSVGGKPYRLLWHQQGREERPGGWTGTPPSYCWTRRSQSRRPRGRPPMPMPPGWRSGSPSCPRATGTPACSGPPAAPPKPGNREHSTRWPRQPGPPGWARTRSGGPSPPHGATPGTAD